MEWNVVATLRQPHFHDGVRLLKQFGDVRTTHYYDVAVLQVADPLQFLDDVTQRLQLHPKESDYFGRVSPCTATFTFQSPEEFEFKARATAQRFLPTLASGRFHVRMHRRGFKGKMHATNEEQFLDWFLLEELNKQGTPGTITFDAPDAIVAVETVDTRAGMAVWSREQLARYPLLGLD